MMLTSLGRNVRRRSFVRCANAGSSLSRARSFCQAFWGRMLGKYIWASSVLPRELWKLCIDDFSYLLAQRYKKFGKYANICSNIWVKHLITLNNVVERCLRRIFSCIYQEKWLPLQSIREMLCECGLRLGKASKLDFSLALHHPCHVIQKRGTQCAGRRLGRSQK